MNSARDENTFHGENDIQRKPAVASIALIAEPTLPYELSSVRIVATRCPITSVDVKNLRIACSRRKAYAQVAAIKVCGQLSKPLN
jgi:hypothetical protein